MEEALRAYEQRRCRGSPRPLDRLRPFSSISARGPLHPADPDLSRASSGVLGHVARQPEPRSGGRWENLREQSWWPREKRPSPVHKLGSSNGAAIRGRDFAAGSVIGRRSASSWPPSPWEGGPSSWLRRAAVSLVSAPAWLSEGRHSLVKPLGGLILLAYLAVMIALGLRLIKAKKVLPEAGDQNFECWHLACPANTTCIFDVELGRIRCRRHGDSQDRHSERNLRETERLFLKLLAGFGIFCTACLLFKLLGRWLTTRLVSCLAHLGLPGPWGPQGAVPTSPMDVGTTVFGVGELSEAKFGFSTPHDVSVGDCNGGYGKLARAAAVIRTRPRRERQVFREGRRHPKKPEFDTERRSSPRRRETGGGSSRGGRTARGDGGGSARSNPHRSPRRRRRQEEEEEVEESQSDDDLAEFFAGRKERRIPHGGNGGIGMPRRDRRANPDRSRYSGMAIRAPARWTGTADSVGRRGRDTGTRSGDEEQGFRSAGSAEASAGEEHSDGYEQDVADFDGEETDCLGWALHIAGRRGSGCGGLASSDDASSQDSLGHLETGVHDELFHPRI